MHSRAAERIELGIYMAARAITADQLIDPILPRDGFLMRSLFRLQKVLLAEARGMEASVFGAFSNVLAGRL